MISIMLSVLVFSTPAEPQVQLATVVAYDPEDAGQCIEGRSTGICSAGGSY